MNEGMILVVEDNDVLRDGLKEMLSIEGFSVITAGNGLEALTYMDDSIPDLILSDIAMPEMDGFKFFNTVRDRSDWVTIPFIFLTARAEPSDIIAGKNLGVEDYLTKPLTREELVTAIRSRLTRSRQLQMAQLKQAYLASLTALANAIDLRDPYTGGHVERVTAYAMTLGERLGWTESRMDPLRYGAILHDIGKIHIRESTLFKDTPLNLEDWTEIRRHPIVGAEMIKDIPYLADAIPIVHSHHERWDGKGYPDGLAGEEIPEGARIVAIVDSFDAMTTIRPYSPARTHQEAYQEIQNCSAKQYDPSVVAAFKAAWEEGQILSIAKMEKYQYIFYNFPQKTNADES